MAQPDALVIFEVLGQIHVLPLHGVVLMISTHLISQWEVIPTETSGAGGITPSSVSALTQYEHDHIKHTNNHINGSVHIVLVAVLILFLMQLCGPTLMPRPPINV